MYNSIENSNDYSKTSGTLWQYYREEPALTGAGAVDNFPGNSASFKFKQKRTNKIAPDGTKNVEIMVLLEHLINF